MFLDELQLSTYLAKDSNKAFAVPSQDVSIEAMIFGILTNKILPGATVLAFSRSGDFDNQELLDKESQVYSILDLEDKDIQEIIQKNIKDSEQRKSILKQIQKFDRNQILFLMQMLKLKENQLGDIRTATDLFLSILWGNLASQNQKSDRAFLKLLKEHQDNLKNTFQLCKENLQTGRKSTDAVIYGKVPDEERWISSSGIELPLTFLKSVGIFEIPPPSSCEDLTLTAQHLSFVEFFASVGILLSSDITAELEKIKNSERFKAVSIYIRNIKLKV